MGTINQGILGGFRGKVGNVVGFFWKGQAVMRSLAGSVANPRTASQMSNRFRFSVAGSLMSVISPIASALIPNYYRTSSVDKTKSQVNILMQNVLTSTSLTQTPATAATDVIVDWSTLELSKPEHNGVLPTGMGATSTTAGHITVTWTDNSSADQTIASNDVIMIVAFVSDRDADGKFINKGVVFDNGQFTRRDQTAQLDVPATWSGNTAEVFIIARSADDYARSNTAYVGSVAVQ